MFKLSLGSKELFHSNFIEYLWETDKNKVVNIFRKLLGQDFLSGKIIDNYELSREKEHFDICLHHKEGNKTKYDVILENKVKSIPLKAQLERYAKDPETRYLLLSLVENFADKEAIEEKGIWKIANYKELKEAIEEQKFGNDVYVKDYCKFIGLLHELQREILDDDNFGNSNLFESIEDYRSCRLHDLYIKLRCYNFLLLLKKNFLDQKLQSSKFPVQFIEKHDEIQKRYNGNCGVYLNVAINQGTGQAAAWIKKESEFIYEIVIQGDQYRHGINAKHLVKNNDKIKSQEYIREQLNNKQVEFLSNCSFPNKCKKSRKYPLNGYGFEYIYRYDSIGDKKVNELLERMADEICKVCVDSNLP